MTTNIRQEQDTDFNAVNDIIVAAFANVEERNKRANPPPQDVWISQMMPYQMPGIASIYKDTDSKANHNKQDISL